VPDRVVDHEARRQISELSVTLMALRERIDREGQANAAALQAIADRVTQGEIADARHSSRLAMIGAGVLLICTAVASLVPWVASRVWP
jgi:hypothetical protein